MREVTIERNTNETQIELTLNLDGGAGIRWTPDAAF